MSKKFKTKPKGQNELTEFSIMLFTRVYKDIKISGKSRICPVELPDDDTVFIYTVDNCAVCRQAFPKALKHNTCPCIARYSKKYLLKRINVKSIKPIGQNELTEDSITIFKKVRGDIKKYGQLA